MFPPIVHAFVYRCRPAVLGLVLLVLASFVSKAQNSTSSVGQDGFIRFNGAKFFPLGYYTEGFAGYAPNEYAATTLAAAGFNTLYTEHDYLNNADWVTFFNKCNSLKLKNIVSFYGDISGNYVNTYKSYPSLLLWGIGDDGNIRYTTNELRNRTNTVHSLDPNHVSYSALTTNVYANDAANLSPYAAVSDVSGMEWYPIYKADDFSRYDHALAHYRLDTACARYGNASIAILQTYRWGGDADNVWPTGTQIQCMSYAALTAGVKGIIYYTFKDYDQNSTINQTQSGLWNATVDFAGKMNRVLMPVVLNGTFHTLSAQVNVPNVNVAYWDYQGDTYVIIVNTNSGSRTVDFSLPATGTATNLFSDFPATLTYRNNRFSGSVGAGQVQVYKIATSTASTYYRIKNRWQGTYLYDNGEQLGYGTGSGTTYQWSVENAGGFTQLKNRSTGDYLHIETSKDYVECTGVNTGWWSKDWTLEDYDGHQMIRNRWKSDQYLHIEHLKGYAQHTSIAKGTWSSQWRLESVNSARLSAEPPVSSKLQLSPNPARESVTLTLQAQQGQTVVVSLLNSQGVRAGQVSKVVEAGKQQVQIPLRGYCKGLYLLQLTLDGQRHVKKLVVE